jgi:hypothetical protein
LKDSMKQINLLLCRHHFFILNQIDEYFHFVKISSRSHENMHTLFNHITDVKEEKQMLKKHLTRLVYKVGGCVSDINLKLFH